MTWKNTESRYGQLSIGLHAAAGLFHHHVRRDNALRIMLPGRE